MFNGSCLGCVDPRDVTSNHIDREVYEEHNAGKTVAEIAASTGRDPDDVRERIARIWQLDRMRCLEFRRGERL